MSKRVDIAASADPVARVAVDVSLAHLDRPFDYLVPERLSQNAVPGARVRVRFAGRLVDGFVLERLAESDHGGRLSFISGAPSSEVVLTPELLRLCRAVADRYAGALADVLRLAIPPRHATVEAEDVSSMAPRVERPGSSTWSAYDAGVAFVSALADGKAPRAIWNALPAAWPHELATALAATAASGRGALAVLPDHRDVARLAAALDPLVGTDDYVSLRADVGPAERYRRFLRVSRGVVPIVIGTRAAGFAPVRDIGLVAIWDDGDDLHAEPHAPYPHMREVLLLRAHLAGAAALIGGYARTAEAAALLASGWAHPVEPSRSMSRGLTPRVQVAGTDAELARDGAARAARLPTLAWQAARDGLVNGPVLVQVPRAGYHPALSCAECRTPARCLTCGGPLARPRKDAVPACRWCGHPATAWACPVCTATTLRSSLVGAARTAEELGRAFPGVPVRTSGGDRVLDQVGSEPVLVVATPGAEPVAVGGYSTVLLLDGWLLLSRPGLRAAEEALRRWLNAAALARPGADGGRVIVLAEGELPVVQALIRWDPAGYAERELAERTSLRFPPAVRMAALTGLPAALQELVAVSELPGNAEVLGPVAIDESHERLLVRVPRADGTALSVAIKSAIAQRTSRKAPESVKVEIDPLEPI